MPMSQACMDGIAANDHRWKHQISLGGETNRMGTMDFGTPDADVEKCALAIVAHARRFTSRAGLDENMISAINADLDALEDVADCGLDEVRFAMNSVYDQFDYWRICVIS